MNGRGPVCLPAAQPVGPRGLTKHDARASRESTYLKTRPLSCDTSHNLDQVNWKKWTLWFCNGRITVSLSLSTIRSRHRHDCWNLKCQKLNLPSGFIYVGYVISVKCVTVLFRLLLYWSDRLPIRAGIRFSEAIGLRLVFVNESVNRRRDC